jgi:hypothetical protein
MEEIRGRRAMLCFPQMVTKTEITAEQYLPMTFEHGAGSVHGEIVDRHLPYYIHGRLQALLLSRFETQRLLACSNVRMKIAPNVYRIPDAAVIPKDDRQSDLTQKLEGYRHWGVAHSWVVSSLTLPSYPFQLTPTDLFSDL